MLLGIAHNPNSEDPKALFDKLRDLSGTPASEYFNAETDYAGLAALKEKLSVNAPRKVE